METGRVWLEKKVEREVKTQTLQHLCTMVCSTGDGIWKFLGGVISSKLWKDPSLTSVENSLLEDKNSENKESGLETLSDKYPRMELLDYVVVLF